MNSNAPEIKTKNLNVVLMFEAQLEATGAGSAAAGATGAGARGCDEAFLLKLLREAM